MGFVYIYVIKTVTLLTWIRETQLMGRICTYKLNQYDQSVELRLRYCGPPKMHFFPQDHGKSKNLSDVTNQVRRFKIKMQALY